MNSKKTQIAIIAIFLIFTFGLTAAFFVLPKKAVSSDERRPLAAAPEISLESFLSGDLSEELEGSSGGYIPDHFPFRSFFVGVNSYFNYMLGNTASNNYYNSRDGYIITNPPKENNSEQNIAQLNDFAASADEKITLTVVPSAGYILSDLLPLNHVSYPDEEVFASIENNLSEDFSFVDLRDSFADAHKAGTQIYYKTDHHWTSEGTYLAYTKLCESLGITPLAKDKLTVSTYEGFYGTTYSSSGYFLVKPDVLELWENKAVEDSIKVTIDDGKDTKTYGSMYFRDHLEVKSDSINDMYAVFLNGNSPLVTIENSKATSDKTLVVIKDSFAHCMAPYLANNYGKVILVDLRYYQRSVLDLAKGEDREFLVLYGMENFCTDTNLFRLNFPLG